MLPIVLIYLWAERLPGRMIQIADRWHLFVSHVYSIIVLDRNSVEFIQMLVCFL